MSNKIIRSPFFYVGDKYKLMNQLKKLFPEKINTYIEPFCGGGSSFINTNAKKYLLNDVDSYIVGLHLFLQEYKDNSNKLLNDLIYIIDFYKLSCSFTGKFVPIELKKQYAKTYYSKYNKCAYLNLRNDYNEDKKNSLFLYILLIYGFNHMIRFNNTGDFNLPVGNLDFNKNVHEALMNYLKFSNNCNLQFYNLDYIDFLKNIEFSEGDYVFFDPPYLISTSEYNKLWNVQKEKELYKIMDDLDAKGVKWGLTNLLFHKGKQNDILENWMNKYSCCNIDSNYISYKDNTIKLNSKEVFITNYGKI